MINSYEKSKKFPLYKPGASFYKTAHILLNADMCKLYKFFNPDYNQVIVRGDTTSETGNVPRLLEALGYEVRWDDTSWEAPIPEQFRVIEVTQKVIKRW